MVRRFFDNQSAAAILEIKITISAEEDKFFWVPDKKGSFSVKSTYQERRFRRNRTQVQWDWNKIGKLIIQHSLCLLIWKIAAEALPLRGRTLPFTRSNQLEQLYCPVSKCNINCKTSVSGMQISGKNQFGSSMCECLVNTILENG